MRCSVNKLKKNWEFPKVNGRGELIGLGSFEICDTSFVPGFQQPRSASRWHTCGSLVADEARRNPDHHVRYSPLAEWMEACSNLDAKNRAFYSLVRSQVGKSRSGTRDQIWTQKGVLGGGLGGGAASDTAYIVGEDMCDSCLRHTVKEAAGPSARLCHAELTVGGPDVNPFTSCHWFVIAFCCSGPCRIMTT